MLFLLVSLSIYELKILMNWVVFKLKAIILQIQNNQEYVSINSHYKKIIYIRNIYSQFFLIQFVK